MAVPERDYAFVQPVLVAKTGSHEDVVAAAALASTRAWLATPDDPAWAEWFGGRIAKTVRRVSGPQFDAAANLAVVETAVGGARALGFVPCTYEGMAPQVRKGQVAGTNMERSGSWITAESGPVVVVNAAVDMSTGKAGAQVAHGLFLWAMGVDEPERAAWVASGFPFSVRELSGAEFDAAATRARVVVRDAGFTEVDPGSVTVLALGQ